MDVQPAAVSFVIKGLSAVGVLVSADRDAALQKLGRIEPECISYDSGSATSV